MVSTQNATKRENPLFGEVLPLFHKSVQNMHFMPKTRKRTKTVFAGDFGKLPQNALTTLLLASRLQMLALASNERTALENKVNYALSACSGRNPGTHYHIITKY